MNRISNYKRPLFTGFLIGISVIVVLLIIADLPNVLTVLSGIDKTILPLIFILAPLNYLLRYFKWNYYLKIAGIYPESKINRYIFLSGLSMTITPGKLGELLKCYLLKEHLNTPVSQTSSIVMAERVTDALAMVVLASFGFLAYPYGRYVVPATAGILLTTIVLFRTDSLFTFLSRKLVRSIFLNKGMSFINEFQQSAKLLFSVRSLLYAIGIGVVSWGFEGFVVFLTVKALGGKISILGSFFVVSFSSLLGGLSFLPGGLGVAEGSIMAILVLTGMGKEMAAATTVITRFSTLWLGVAVGVIGLILLQKEFNKTKTVESN